MRRHSLCLLALLFTEPQNASAFHLVGNHHVPYSRKESTFLSASKQEVSSFASPESAPLAKSKQKETRVSWKHSVTAAVIALTLSTGVFLFPSTAMAYERTYPGELNEDYTYLDGRQRQLDKIKQREANAVAPVTLGPGYKPLSSILWGGALWLLAGSRSNPLVTPLANLVYSYNNDNNRKNDREDDDETEMDNNDWEDKEESAGIESSIIVNGSETSSAKTISTIPTSTASNEVQPEPSISNNRDWLQDRNDGLFADIPPTLYVILAVVFVSLGAVLDAGLMIATEGDRNVSLQLAGVSLISGASLELGRIASGEKGQTRSEAERAQQLEDEFQQFAMDRLKVGGNCHRSEVVQAFRRYYAQYRDDELLGDLEIEQLLKSWTQRYCPRVERSAAGFYTGIQINTQADIFVQR